MPQAKGKERTEMANIGVTTAFYKVETSDTCKHRSQQEHGASAT